MSSWRSAVLDATSLWEYPLVLRFQWDANEVLFVEPRTYKLVAVQAAVGESFYLGFGPFRRGSARGHNYWADLEYRARHVHPDEVINQRSAMFLAAQYNDTFGPNIWTRGWHMDPQQIITRTEQGAAIGQQNVSLPAGYTPAPAYTDSSKVLPRLLDWTWGEFYYHGFITAAGSATIQTWFWQTDPSPARFVRRMDEDTTWSNAERVVWVQPVDNSTYWVMQRLESGYLLKVFGYGSAQDLDSGLQTPEFRATDLHDFTAVDGGRDEDRTMIGFDLTTTRDANDVGAIGRYVWDERINRVLYIGGGRQTVRGEHVLDLGGIRPSVGDVPSNCSGLVGHLPLRGGRQSFDVLARLEDYRAGEIGDFLGLQLGGGTASEGSLRTYRVRGVDMERMNPASYLELGMSEEQERGIPSRWYNVVSFRFDGADMLLTTSEFPGRLA